MATEEPIYHSTWFEENVVKCICWMPAVIFSTLLGVILVQSLETRDLPSYTKINIDNDDTDDTQCIADGTQLRMPSNSIRRKLPFRSKTMPEISIRTRAIQRDGSNFPPSICNRDPTVEQRASMAGSAVPQTYIVNATLSIAGMQVLPELTLIDYSKRSKQSMIVSKLSDDEYYLSTHHTRSAFRKDDPALPAEGMVSSCSGSFFEVYNQITKFYIPSEPWGYTYGARPTNPNTTQCAITEFFYSCG